MHQGPGGAEANGLAMMRELPILSFQVEPQDAGRTYRTVLRSRYGMSRTLLRRLQRGGALHVDGRALSVDDPAAPGARVDVFVPYEPTPVPPEDLPVAIVHEDRHILIANKPPGMLVHPTSMEPTGSLTAALVHHLTRTGETPFVGPVTRLDKGTSGLVLCAKNPYAHYRLSRQMESGLLERVYLAFVCGWLETDAGSIDAPVRRVEGTLSRREVGGGGQRAVTHYRVLGRYQGRGGTRASLVQVRLETGRTHQIRVHFAHVGHPLLGDRVYGVPREGPELERPALHASELRFLHPVDGRALHFTAPLPGDMQDVLAQMRAVTA